MHSVITTSDYQCVKLTIYQYLYIHIYILSNLNVRKLRKFELKNECLVLFGFLHLQDSTGSNKCVVGFLEYRLVCVYDGQS